MVWESVCLGPFQTEIIEGWVKPLLGYTSYVMITPLKVEGQSWETKPLPPGLHVLHTYTRLKNSSGKVSLVVKNVSDNHIFLKQYDEVSMCPHIFTNLHGYPGKWAHTLDEGNDISVQDLLMHTERTFGNKHNYDAPCHLVVEY